MSTFWHPLSLSQEQRLRADRTHNIPRSGFLIFGLTEELVLASFGANARVHSRFGYYLPWQVPAAKSRESHPLSVMPLELSPLRELYLPLQRNCLLRRRKIQGSCSNLPIRPKCY